MTATYTIHEGMYQHLTLEGSSYDVGFAQGMALKASGARDRTLAPGDVDPQPYGFASFAELQRMYDAFCPGITDELQGVADALEIPPSRLAFYADSYAIAPHCAQMVALPPVVADGHVLVGRSYELGLLDAELRLCTTRVEGRYAHIGFSGALFGRWDGMNSAGLSVTSSAGTSAGLPHEWVKVRGFNAWIVLRAILETCATVPEALTVLAEAPTDYVNIIVADRSGQAALVEVGGARRAVRQIGGDSADAYLVATNHYTSAEMASLNTFEPVIGHSMPRYRAIQACIEEDAPRVTVETFRRVLSREFPDGCFCPYYQQWFGTLRQLIFDLSAGTAEICFGAPGHNPWHTFTLESAPGIATYPALFPQR